MVTSAVGASPRSRSPRRPAAPLHGALAPLRDDAPGRRARSRGAPADLSTASARTAAVSDLVRGFHAASSIKTHDAMWRTTLKRLVETKLPVSLLWGVSSRRNSLFWLGGQDQSFGRLVEVKRPFLQLLCVSSRRNGLFILYVHVLTIVLLVGAKRSFLRF